MGVPRIKGLPVYQFKKEFETGWFGGKVTGYVDGLTGKEVDDIEAPKGKLLSVEYDDEDRESMSLTDLKRLVKLSDSYFSKQKEWKEQFSLPFTQKITPSMVVEADHFRVEGQYPKQLCHSTWKNYALNAYRASERHKFRLDLRREVKGWHDFKCEPANKRTVDRTYTDEMIGRIFSGMREGHFVNDVVIQRFAAKFNTWQHDLAESYEGHQPAVMFDGYIADSLYNHYAASKRQKLKMIRRLCFRVKGAVKKFWAGLDLFTNVSRLFFPLNLRNSHWVLFEVDLSNLRQIYYDSMWDKMTKKSLDVSQLIHMFLCDYHKSSLGEPHPKLCPWSRELVLDDHREIGNAKQTSDGMDCGLHTCIVTVFRQSNIPLWVLSVNSENVSREMRVRMTLLLVRDEWYFEPDWPKVRKLRSMKIKDVPVEKKGTMIEQINALRESIVVDELPGGIRSKRKRRSPD